MSTQVQWRRGTTSEHSGFTGVTGEVSVDVTKSVVVVHDGATAGGHPMAHERKKLTTAQRDALTPTEGDEIYNLDIHRPEFYDGTTWQTL